MANLSGLVIGAPFVSGGTVYVPVDNAGGAVSIHLTFQVWATLVPISTPPLGSPCFTGECGRFSTGRTNVPVAPFNLGCWTDCSPRFLLAKTRNDSAQYVLTSSNGSVAHPGNCASYSRVLASRAPFASGRAEFNSTYYAFPLSNPTPERVRSQIRLSALAVSTHEQSFRALLEDSDLVTAMANRDLRFGPPRFTNISLGRESQSRPPERQYREPDELTLADCDCDRKQLASDALPHTGDRPYSGPTYGVLDSRAEDRLVPEEEWSDRFSSLVVDQLPWQESQLLIRVDYGKSDRWVSLLRVEQHLQVPGPQGSSYSGDVFSEEVFHYFEVATIPKFDAFA
jgi:hypothetical protein